MSDLFCAATVIVARHGDAEYDTDLASDDGGSLTLRGRDQCRQLVLGSSAICEMVVDADGWVLRTWNGQPLDALQRE